MRAGLFFDTQKEIWTMGWNASNGANEFQKPTAPANGGGMRRCILSLLLVLIGAAAVLLCFRCRSKSPEDVKRPRSLGRIATVTNDVAKPRPATSGNTARAIEHKTNDVWLGVEVDRRRACTNGTLVVETIYTKDGKSHIYYHDTRPNVFEHASDQILALATADAPGGAPPLPMVSNFEAEFARSLKTEIVVNEEDPPDVRAMKERVKVARKEMLELMSEGMDADEILKKATEQRESDAAIRMEAVRLVKQMLDAGDREGAEELCAKYNEALENMGIMKIELPGNRRRKD